MKSFAFDAWDEGRLRVNAAFSALLQRHGLTTCERIWTFSDGAEAAKALRRDRVTLRFTLIDAEGRGKTFYIKRHGRSSWKEYVKPWLQGQPPLLGAEPEWEALLAFHDCGLPTMTPVAFGRLGERSFLITEGLEGCEKLSALLAGSRLSEEERRRVIGDVAAIARSMHGSRLHHQDFYLGHFLREKTGGRTYVIDLGRARRHAWWFARRWIVKDLAELNYSAKGVRGTERLRFLRAYLGRSLEARDRRLVRSVLRKTARIARHSGRNGL